jgi:hypothetical protein
LSHEVFQRLVHVPSKPPQEQKNAGEPSPTFLARGGMPCVKWNVDRRLGEGNRARVAGRGSRGAGRG